MSENSLGKRLSLNEIHAVLLKMLIRFDQFCEKHGLTYYLIAGSLLGAVRHDGFIPWDDDADILMPRKDYEKLLTYRYVDTDIEIISFKDKSSVHYHPFPYIDLSDTNTIEKPHMLKKDTHKGQFIDVFPLDSIPDNPFIERKQRIELFFLTTIRFCAMSTYRKPCTVKNIIFNIVSLLFSSVDLVKLSSRIDSIAKRYSNEATNKVGMIVFNECKKFRWYTSWFDKREKHRFENASLYIPSNYHEILTVQYGDYMIPPPEAERIGHHFVEIYWKETEE